MIKIAYPSAEKLDATITLPGSKYLANRLLILAALSDTPTYLSNMPHNEDIDTSIKGLGLLGAKFSWQVTTWCKWRNRTFKKLLFFP